jgi:Zn-finger nucleic acid-binding protein
MPLLVCPNDNANMQTLNRSGVEFDFCPTCRGIWLDRGELEKLMAAARDDGSGDDPRRDPAPRSERRRYRDDDDDDDRRWDDDGYRRKRRRGLGILDIFD